MNVYDHKTLIRKLWFFFLCLYLLLKSTPIMAGEVTLSFTPNDETTESYKIFSRLPSESYDYNQPAATLDQSSCSTVCEITFSILSGTRYYFVIRAYDSDNASEDSDEILFLPEDFPNTAPTADAGADRNVLEQAIVTLDASNTIDPDGSIVSYRWEQIDGQIVTLDGANTQIATFTSPDVTSDGAALTFELTVTDNCGVEATDHIIINVTYDNIPPVASAGEDKSVYEGSIVTLSASGSTDSDGQLLSYRWTQQAGPSVTLTESSSAQARFTAPDVGSNGSDLEFKLEVTDNGGLKSSDTILVHVDYINTAPFAHAGDDQILSEGTVSQLNASASKDSDGNLTGYLWQQLSGTPVNLSGSDTSIASFTAPVISKDQEVLTFSVTVTDNGGLKSTDIIDVTVNHINLSPQAAAGTNQSVIHGTTVTLDGSRSKDTDDGIASYQWTQTNGDTVTLDTPNSAETSFSTDMLSNLNQMLTFQLTVTDTKGLTASDSVEITIQKRETTSSESEDQNPDDSPEQDNSTEPAPLEEDETTTVVQEEIDYSQIDMTPSVEVFNAGTQHKEWLLLSWSDFDNMDGETRITSGDIDGDGRDELIIGMGKEHDANIPNGLFQILDDDYSHLAWGKIEWPEYNEINGESIPATGDFNGDGIDEIIIGLGDEGRGRVEIFSYTKGKVVHQEWITLDWSDYNHGIGRTRPATGDIDGDRKDELIIGLGPSLFNAVQPNGLFRVIDHDYTPLAWGEISWPEYNALNGESIPSSGDMNGDGIDEIIIGLGEGGNGKLSYFSFNTQSQIIVDNGWIEIDWQEYNEAVGKTRPALGDIDGDDRDELIVGFGQDPLAPSIPGGFFLVLNEDYSPLNWAEIEWENYRQFNGESYPASGDLNGDGEDEIIIGLGSKPSLNISPIPETSSPPATDNSDNDSGSSGSGGGCFIETILLSL